MNKIQHFMQRAIASQMQMAGEPFSVQRPKTKEAFDGRGVFTSRDGSLTAEIGGTIYSISAHVLIPSSGAYSPKVGDRLQIEGKSFMVVNTIKSPNDAAYSCDLVQVQI